MVRAKPPSRPEYCTTSGWRTRFISTINCKVATAIADRVYLYDNSVDGHEARILFRFADGAVIKRYTDNIPIWA